MLLGAIFFDEPMRTTMMSFPLIIGAVCIIGSVIGTFFVRLGSGGIMGALYKGLIVSGVISAALIAVVIAELFGFNAAIKLTNGVITTGTGMFGFALGGLALTRLLVWIPEYCTSTSHRPALTVPQRSIAVHGH